MFTMKLQPEESALAEIPAASRVTSNAAREESNPPTDAAKGGEQMEVLAASHLEGAATKGTELAAEIREKTNGLFATPPIITDAAKEIDECCLHWTEQKRLSGIESILSRLLDAQAGEVKRLKEEVAQLKHETQSQSRMVASSPYRQRSAYSSQVLSGI